MQSRAFGLAPCGKNLFDLRLRSFDTPEVKGILEPSAPSNSLPAAHAALLVYVNINSFATLAAQVGFARRDWLAGLPTSAN